MPGPGLCGSPPVGSGTFVYTSGFLLCDWSIGSPSLYCKPLIGVDSELKLLKSDYWLCISFRETADRSIDERLSPIIDLSVFVYLIKLKSVCGVRELSTKFHGLLQVMALLRYHGDGLLLILGCWSKCVLFVV